MLILVGTVLAACGTAHSATRTGTATARTASATCVPAGAHALASDPLVAVYSLHGSVDSCDTKSGKRVRLGSAAVCIASARVDRAVVAGGLVAYGLETCGVDTGGASVTVRRARDGKQLKNYPAATTGLLPEAYQAVTSIVLKRDAGVAWIATVHSIIGRGTSVAVYRNGRLLDSGPGIGPRSLRLHGTTLSWQHGASERNATLR